jgi:hypothetical protein
MRLLTTTAERNMQSLYKVLFPTGDYTVAHAIVDGILFATIITLLII